MLPKSFRNTALRVLMIMVAACDSSDTGSGNNGNGTGNGTGSGTPTGSGGGGVVVGPDLNTAGTANTFGCADGYPIQTNATFPQPFYASGQSSCLVLTFLAPTTDGPKVNDGATAVSATIRAGAVVGPMRFVRMRILFNRKVNQQCCSLQEYGNEFTPTANGTTTVPLNFKMTLEPLPAQDDLTTTIANDLIALEVLAPNVPIPGVWPANGGPVDGTASYMWLPALSAQKQAAPSASLLNYTGSYSGFVPTFNVSFANP